MFWLLHSFVTICFPCAVLLKFSRMRHLNSLTPPLRYLWPLNTLTPWTPSPQQSETKLLSKCLFAINLQQCPCRRLGTRPSCSTITSPPPPPTRITIRIPTSPGTIPAYQQRPRRPFKRHQRQQRIRQPGWGSSNVDGARWWQLQSELGATNTPTQTHSLICPATHACRDLQAYR